MRDNINFKVKKDYAFSEGMVLKVGTEIKTINGMIYVNGYPLYANYYNMFSIKLRDEKFIKEYLVEDKLVNNKFL